MHQNRGQERGKEEQEEEGLKKEGADCSKIVVIELEVANVAISWLGVMTAKGPNAKILIQM